VVSSSSLLREYFALPGALSLSRSAASDFLRLISRRFSRRKMNFTVTAGHQ
jgi:hypothetical protein